MHAGAGFFEFANGRDLTSQVTSCLQRTPVRARRKLRASRKDQSPSPLRHHPARDQQAEVAKASGDQIAAVSAPSQRSFACAGLALSNESRHHPPPLPKAT